MKKPGFLIPACSSCFLRPQVVVGQASRIEIAYDDFGLDMGDMRIVVMPAGVKPGPVLVTITNTGARRTCDPITISVEIADSKKER